MHRNDLKGKKSLKTVLENKSKVVCARVEVVSLDRCSIVSNVMLG